MFVKYHFVALVVCLFVVAVFLLLLLLLLSLFIIIVIIIIIIVIIFFNWYKLDCEFLQSYVNFFAISNKVLIKNVMASFTNFLNNFRKPYVTTYREELTRLKQSACVDVT